MLILQFCTPCTRPTIIIHRTFNTTTKSRTNFKRFFFRNSNIIGCRTFYITFWGFDDAGRQRTAPSLCLILFYINHIAFIIRTDFPLTLITTVSIFCVQYSYTLYQQCRDSRNNTNCKSIRRLYYIKYLLCKKMYCKLFAFVKLLFKGQYISINY